MKRNYHYLCILFIGLFFAVSLNAQIPQIDPKAGQSRIVVIDDNFEVKKPTGPIFRRSITCEAWITTDGTLHCKTKVKIASASVKYTLPTQSSTATGGTTTSAGGDKTIKLTVKELVLGQDTYTWDISGEKYREMHMITLYISNPLSSGQVILINKKVPEKITK